TLQFQYGPSELHENPRRRPPLFTYQAGGRRTGRGLPLRCRLSCRLGAARPIRLLEDESTRNVERPRGMSEGEDEPRALLRLEPRGVRGAEVFPGRRGPPEGAPLRLRHDAVVRRTLDTIQGILRAYAASMDGGRDLLGQEFHFVTGRGVSVSDLAGMIIALTGSSAQIVLGPANNFDVRKFVGSPAKSHKLLGYKPKVT